MSVEVADSNGPFAQVASNNGFQDLVDASQSDPVLKTFFYYAATEDTHTVAEHLRALQARDDIEKTAKGMADLIMGHEFVILTRGESADVPDENGIADPSAQKLFKSVLKAEAAGGTVRAHLAGFKALQNEGYQRKDKVWIEKGDPTVGDTHINRPMGAVKYTGDGENKPKCAKCKQEKCKCKRDKDKDDPGTQDVTPYGMDKSEKEKDDPGTQDVAPGETKLALPLPKYKHNQFNNAHKIAKRISGSSPIPLNKPGEHLATKLGKRIQARGGLDVLGSSTLKRGKQTAARIAEQNPGTAMATPTPALVPWKLGDYEGRMPKDVKDFVQAYIEHPDERPPGTGADGEKAETFNEAAKRQLKYFVKRHSDWEGDPTMKLADVVHSRGLEL
jgi:broad specificity phosphatase PhoE